MRGHTERVSNSLPEHLPARPSSLNPPSRRHTHRSATCTRNLKNNKPIPSWWTRTKHDVPWVSRELKRQCNTNHWFWKRAKKTNKPSHWEAYNMVNRSLGTAEKEHYTKLFRNHIKSRWQDIVGVSPLKKKGQLYSDSKTNASIFQDQFTSVFTTDDTKPKNRLNMDS